MWLRLHIKVGQQASGMKLHSSCQPVAGSPHPPLSSLEALQIGKLAVQWNTVRAEHLLKGKLTQAQFHHFSALDLSGLLTAEYTSQSFDARNLEIRPI